MAFTSKDGKKFGNRQRMAAYDSRAPKELDARKGANPKGQEPEGDNDASGQDINEVVAQHGPAQSIEIEHDHEGGKHTVTSHHGSKMHRSEHTTAEEAHHHAGLAAGLHAGDPTSDMTKEMGHVGSMMQEPGMGY